MIRTTLAIGGLIVFGFVTYLAIQVGDNNGGSENPYQAFRRLRQESKEVVPSPERRAEAHNVAEKMFNAYRLLQYISFEEKTEYYWCEAESREAHKSLEKWSSKRWIATARLRCSQELQVAEISASTPNGGEKNFNYRLTKNQPLEPAPEGVDGEAICASGIHRHWWIGPDLHEPEIIRQRINSGEWLGKTEYCGSRCDVVLTIWQNDPWVFFVRKDGFLALWLKIEPFKQKGSAYDTFDTLIRAKSYSYFNFR